MLVTERQIQNHEIGLEVRAKRLRLVDSASFRNDLIVGQCAEQIDIAATRYRVIVHDHDPTPAPHTAGTTFSRLRRRLPAFRPDPAVRTYIAFHSSRRPVTSHVGEIAQSSHANSRKLTWAAVTAGLRECKCGSIAFEIPNRNRVQLAHLSC